MARIMVIALLVLVSVFFVVRAHVAEGKPDLKTIASIVVHAHHHHAFVR
jgi:hypothetical protein